MQTVKNTNITLTKVNSPEDLASSACDRFIKTAEESIRQRGVFTVAISGGQTPSKFFELLGDSPTTQAVQWDKVQLFWVDERCVPPEADASNYRLAADTFLGKVSIPEVNVHRVTGENRDYSAAVAQYEQTIKDVFGIKQKGIMPKFDLIVLGMGADGHIGSLFPTSYALFDTEDIVSVVYFMNGEYNRITLTHPVLCASKQLVILVSGSEKAQILSDVLSCPPDEVKYPVHTLWPILDKVTWIVDAQAAKFI